jgi:hypothetical protein
MEEALAKKVFNYSDSTFVLSKIVKEFGSLPYDSQKHKAVYGENDKTYFSFRPPLVFPQLQSDLVDNNYVQQITEMPKPYCILLMQAGSAALAFATDGDISKQKVIRKYMVRKSQGKMQLKHLKTKGKSRLGSRIRLRQSDKFFTEINEQLTQWNCLDNCENILYSAAQSIWIPLFDESYTPAFKRLDSRLRKIHIHIQECKAEQLSYINSFAKKSLLEIYNAEYLDFFESLEK